MNTYVIVNFKIWEQVFTLMNENVFKYENFTEYYNKFVEKVTEHLNHPAYMQSAIIIMNTINKVRKFDFYFVLLNFFYVVEENENAKRS